MKIAVKNTKNDTTRYTVELHQDEAWPAVVDAMFSALRVTYTYLNEKDVSEYLSEQYVDSSECECAKASAASENKEAAE